MEIKPGIQTFTSNLIDQFQVSFNQQNQQFEKDKSTPVKEWEILNYLANFKKLRNPTIKKLISFIHQSRKLIRNLNPEGRKLESQASFLRQKRKIKTRQVKFSFKLKPQLPNLYQQKKTQTKSIEVQRRRAITIKKTNQKQIRLKLSKKCKHNENFTSSLQQNVAIVVKRLEFMEVMFQMKKRMFEQHRKQFETSRRLYCNCFGGIYRKKLVVIESNVTILKQDLDNQQQQNKKLQKDNDDLRIYLEKLEKNNKKMEEQFQEIIEEKKELSQFQIDSDEDMHS